MCLVPTPGSLVTQLVKNCAMGETCLRSVGWEDALEKGKAPVFWPGESNGLYSPWGHKEFSRTERLSQHSAAPLTLPLVNPSLKAGVD